MNNLADWLTPWFDGEAKVVNDEMFWTSSLMELCRQNNLNPRSLTEEKLLEIGVARDKFPIIRPIIAKKILEYYGLQGWEMKNTKRVEDVKMTREHYEFITRSLSIEGCFAKFLRSNCWDRVDSDWEWTQYDRIIQQFPTPEEATQKIVVIQPTDVNKTLIRRYNDDIKRIDQELNNPKTTKERKEALEQSKSILEHKLEKLNDEDNAPGDWWSE